MSTATKKKKKSLLLLPGYDPYYKAQKFYFDEEAGDAPVEFFEELMTHVKGEWAGTPLLLRPWQKCFLRNLFGWKRKTTKMRRYRQTLMYVARKNAKSTVAAAALNFLLFCDGEGGAEIYCGAAERDQAALVFNIAKRMIQNEPSLSPKVEIFQHSIALEKMGSFIRPISREANSAHGFNAHACVLDELHCHKKPDLHDALVTAVASRRQSLIIMLTTADYDRPSICNRVHKYACGVRDKIIDDPTFLPCIYESDRDDDWTVEATWKKANPNYGVSVDPEYIARECKKAQAMPEYENTFRRFHLNQIVEQASRWIQMAAFDKCQTLGPATALRGKRCFAGLDLSSTRDITALVLLFPQSGAILPFFWLPGLAAQKRQDEDRVPYKLWEAQGHLETTHGNEIDYTYIRKKVAELADLYDIAELGFDPSNATQLATQLQDEDGLTVRKVPQSFRNMNEPTKLLGHMIYSGDLQHDGNPVLRWMVGNVALANDSMGNIRPSKEMSGEKIDGISAAVCAISCLILDSNKETKYEPGDGFTFI